MNDSQKIHEARGMKASSHEWVTIHGGYDWCLRCCNNISAFDPCIPDYRTRENLAELMDAVREILGDDDRKWGLFFGGVLIRTGINPLTPKADATMFKKQKAIFNAPQDAIVDALLEVIGGSDE